MLAFLPETCAIARRTAHGFPLSLLQRRDNHGRRQLKAPWLIDWLIGHTISSWVE
jgi:hypothetical protein